MRARWVVAAVGVLCGAVPVAAQSADTPAALRRGHVAITGGASWTGRYEVGTTTADLRGNVPGAGGTNVVLFRADSVVAAAPGVVAGVTWALTSNLAVDAGLSYARPRLVTTIAGDAELPGDTVIDDTRLAQYTIEVGATWQLPMALSGGRLRPFLAGGAGYLRQLYDERTIVETGRLFYAGGGVRYFLRGGDGVRRGVGLRGDIRASWRRDGVEFDGRTRRLPSATLQVFAEL